MSVHPGHDSRQSMFQGCGDPEAGISPTPDSAHPRIGSRIRSGSGTEGRDLEIYNSPLVQPDRDGASVRAQALSLGESDGRRADAAQSRLVAGYPGCALEEVEYRQARGKAGGAA